MQSTIFREYDIRGKVGSELLLDNVYDLTHAIVTFFMQQCCRLKTVAVGMDGRTHSPFIKQQVCAALQDAGCDVIDIGVCPSPVLYFAEYTLPVEAGIMITASHNPKEYNGFKLVLQHESVCGSDIKKIEQLYKNGARVVANNKGSVVVQDVIPAYLESLVAEFSQLRGKRMPVVFDCGNGAAGVVMSRVIKAFEWKDTYLLCDHVDGNFPHHDADPVVEKNMVHVKNQLHATDANLGIGFDGDADRMGVMTKDGMLLSGDQILALYADPILKKHPGAGVVCNVLASSALLEHIVSHNGVAHMVAAGHSNIKECMKSTGALVGGESSCHFFFLDGRHPGYDDAVYAALRFLEILDQSGKTVAELLESFPQKISSREYRIPCLGYQADQVIARIKEYANNHPDTHALFVDGVRLTFAEGWFIVRKSNTQEVISLRFESDTLCGYASIKNVLIQLLDGTVNVMPLQESEANLV